MLVSVIQESLLPRKPKFHIYSSYDATISYSDIIEADSLQKAKWISENGDCDGKEYISLGDLIGIQVTGIEW